MWCGYDIGGLDVAACCPECAAPIERTLAVRLARESPSRLRAYVWGFWLSLVAPACGLGMALTALLLSSTPWFRSVPAPPEWLIGLVVLSVFSVQCAGVLFLLVATMLAPGARRAACVAIAGWLAAHALCAAVLLVAARGGGVFFSGEERVMLVLAALGVVSMFVVLLAGPRALAAMTLHLDRFALRPQQARFVLLSTLWHVLGLALLLGTLLVAIADWPPTGPLIPAIAGVGYSVFSLGSAGWCIYLLVTMTRVLKAVNAQRGAASKLGVRASAVPATNAGSRA